MDDINKELRKEAILNGLCMKWQSEWTTNKSQDELVDMYKRGIDFCIKNKYPDIDWVKKNIDKETINKHHVYIDDDVFDVDGSNGSYVVNGESYGIIEIGGIFVSTVYVLGNSNIQVNCADKSIVHVVLYENATAKIRQEGKSSVLCVLRGKNEPEWIEGTVKVVDRRK